MNLLEKNPLAVFGWVGIAIFALLTLSFILLHIWWSKKCKQKADFYNRESIFFFLKTNVFAFFATIWACALLAAISFVIFKN